MTEPHQPKPSAWRRIGVVLLCALVAGFLGFWGGASLAELRTPDQGLILVRGWTILIYGAAAALLSALVAAILAWRGSAQRSPK